MRLRLDDAPARPLVAVVGGAKDSSKLDLLGNLVAKVDDRIAGIVPCYLKSHSQGEYVFDRGWADAYERAGGRYYPKLQASVPFTPATGPRLLIRDGVDREEIGSALASGLIALCGVSKASSAHVTFAREDEWRFLATHGFLQRTDQQFHWHNQGFATFDDFLATMKSVDDATEDRVDDDFGVFLGQIGDARDFLDQLRLGHAAVGHGASH